MRKCRDFLFRMNINNNNLPHTFGLFKETTYLCKTKQRDMKTFTELTKLIIARTAVYSINDERFTHNSSRYNLHVRINHRSQCAALPELAENIESGNSWLNLRHRDRVFTKAQRLEDYECRCIENNIRPFHFTDDQWQDHLNEMRCEEHTNLCEEAEAWMYEL